MKPSVSRKERHTNREGAFVDEVHSEHAVMQRTLIMLGAVTVAGLAVLGFGRQLERWRRSNLQFDYPLEELFI